MSFLEPEIFLGFIPLSVLIWYAISRNGINSLCVYYLILNSALLLLFYAPFSFFVILMSSLLNYIFLALIVRTEKESAFYWLVIGIICNVLFLAYHKNYLYDLLAAVIDADSFITLGLRTEIHPVGVSFYTLSLIALLVTVYNNHDVFRVMKARYYLCFIFFFPKLNAGPIVYAQEFFDEISSKWQGHKERSKDLALGGTIFLTGAFKKLLIAEPLSELTDGIFAISSVELTTVHAWTGMLSYTLQLYFDFSAYSDMAIGLSRIYGIKLPQNFNSPLRSKSFVEFWQNWHMTLIRFFLDHIFTPVSMHFFRIRKIANNKLYALVLCLILPVSITFIASGIWHGSGKHYLYFALFSTLFLIVNHVWRFIKPFKIPAIISWFLMLNALMISLVFVVAGDTDLAFIFLDRYTFNLSSCFDFECQVANSPGSVLTLLHTYSYSSLVLIIALVVALLFPNIYSLTRCEFPALSLKTDEKSGGLMPLCRWRPNFWFSCLYSMMALLVVLNL